MPELAEPMFTAAHGEGSSPVLLPELYLHVQPLSLAQVRCAPSLPSAQAQLSAVCEQVAAACWARRPAFGRGATPCDTWQLVARLGTGRLVGCAPA